MAQFKQLHRWDVTEEEAAAIQSELASQVQKTNSFEPSEIKTIGGIDLSLKEEGQAAIVVLSFPELEVVEVVLATRKLEFPYVPGFLSFRETPLAVAAIEKLKELPDLFMLDGQGYAHPRRFGIACHLGLILDRPTIGCAKSVLWGRYKELGDNAGDQSPLIDFKSKETLGIALRSKVRTNPLIISVGHKIDLPTSVDFVKRCLRGYRLPEPTRIADKYSRSSELPILNLPKPTDEEDGMKQGTLF